MTTTKNTETAVLAHHGIVATPGQNLPDLARAAGLIYACLGCGSVGGINPDAPLGEHASVEAARVATRDSIGMEQFEDCCPDDDCIIY